MYFEKSLGFCNLLIYIIDYHHEYKSDAYLYLILTLYVLFSKHLEPLFLKLGVRPRNITLIGFNSSFITYNYVMNHHYTELFWPGIELDLSFRLILT